MIRDYIVWDIDEKMFFTPTLICQDKSQGIKAYRQTSQASESGYWLDNDECTLHQDSCKTDIEGKKIYADSSIVEFGYFTKHMDTKIIMKGYFTFNLNSLSYSLRTLGSNHQNFDFINAYQRIVGIKIIDTIQENKLGLLS